MAQNDANEMQDAQDDFERERQRERPSLAREFALFLRENKKWWLGPIVVALLLLGLLAALGGSAAAPFIYTLF